MMPHPRALAAFVMALHVAATTAQSAAAKRTAPPRPAGSHAHTRDVAWLDGTLVFPRDTPADEHVEIVLSALPIEKFCSSPIDDENIALVARCIRQGWAECARTLPAADGSFHLALPAERSALRIELDSKYLYLRDLDPWVDVEDPTAPVTLEPKVGGGLRFCLLPPPGTPLDRSPIVGRSVRLEWLPLHGSFRGTPPERVLSISPEHEIVVGGLSPECRYFLEGHPLPFAPLVIPGGVQVHRGRVSDVEIDLAAGLLVAGRVVDALGGPVPAARVHATCRLDRMGFGSEVTTSTDGAFRFEAVHPSLHHINVHCAGFESLRVDRASLYADEQLARLEIVIQRRSGK